MVGLPSIYIVGERSPCVFDSAVYPREIDTETPSTQMQSQTLLFKAATGKAFTTVLAGLALTSHILPKISFLQAFVAGLTRVLIMTRPGKTNLPVLVTSLEPISARLPMMPVTTDALISCSAAIAPC